MNGTMISKMFDGRCVNTIVFSSPNRAPTVAAAMDDAAWSKPAAKNTADINSSDAPKVRSNQKTMNTVTTKPPANASTANSDASLVTRLLDRSRRRPPRAISTSIAPLSPRESTRHATAPTGNSRNQIRSAGAPAHAFRRKAGPPAASAPIEPARYATAL